MGLVQTANLREGMVLAGDVLDTSGRLLIARGTELTPRGIRVLKMWGVIEADVEGVGDEEGGSGLGPDLDPAFVAAAERKARALLPYTNIDHPAGKALYRLCVARLARGKTDPETVARWSRPEEYHPDNTDEGKVRIPVNIVKAVGDSIPLSTLPDVFHQVNEVLLRPSSSAQEIAEVIEKDTNLSARILRIVNSAFYNFPSRIDKISRAVTIMGTRQMATLASGINCLKIFQMIPSRVVDMKSFWEHSLLCGLGARLLGGYKNIQNTERLFVAGMIHDMGLLALYNRLPDVACLIIEKARSEFRPLHEVEKEVLGLDHAELAHILMKRWRFPLSLETIIRYHHRPLRSPNTLEAAIVHLADMIAIAAGSGFSGERRVPPLEAEVWDLLGISPCTIPVVADQALRQLDEIFHYFLYDAP